MIGYTSNVKPNKTAEFCAIASVLYSIKASSRHFKYKSQLGHQSHLKYSA